MRSIKVSKIGYDALTDTDPSHFNLDAEYNTFKFTNTILETNLSLTSNGDGTPISTSVNLSNPLSGYFPYYFAYITSDIAGTLYTAYGNLNLPAVAGGQAFVYGDLPNNQLVCEFDLQNQSSGTSGTYTVNYYIYLFANPV